MKSQVQGIDEFLSLELPSMSALVTIVKRGKGWRKEVPNSFSCYESLFFYERVVGPPKRRAHNYVIDIYGETDLQIHMFELYKVQMQAHRWRREHVDPILSMDLSVPRGLCWWKPLILICFALLSIARCIPNSLPWRLSRSR